MQETRFDLWVGKGLLGGGGCSGIANYKDLNHGGGGRNTKGKVTVRAVTKETNKY